jgi:toxin ParE1/3/4
MSLRLRPDLLQDLHDAAGWYESASLGLGDEFRRAFFAELDLIAALPLSHRLIYRDFRRTLLPRFPYLIYFKVEGETVIIFLLIHSSRDPDTVRSLLRER